VRGAAGVEVVLDGLRFPEGPVWQADGSLWCVELRGGAVVRVGVDGSVRRHVTGGEPNGLLAAPDGDGLWFCDAGRDRVRRLAADGTTRDVLTAVAGTSLARPNDLVSDGRGTVVVTCPGASRDVDTGYVVARTADGVAIRVGGGLRFPNGLALTPDGRHLLVAETYRGRILRGRWDPAAVAWHDVEVLVDGLPGAPGPDGMAFAGSGMLLVALFGAARLAVVDPSGRLVGEVALPGARPTNVAVGPAGDALVTEAETGTLLLVRNRGRW
jgi:gluconolactonase